MSLESARALAYGMVIGGSLGAWVARRTELQGVASRAQGVVPTFEEFDILLPTEPQRASWNNNSLVTGWLFHGDLPKLHKAAASAQLFVDGTSRDIAASIAAAYLVALALNGVRDHEYARHVVEYTDGLSASLDAAFYRLGHSLAWSDEAGAMAHVWRDGGDECLVVLACYCLMRFPTDFVAAVHRAVSFGGQGARLGYLVGGMMGAKLGLAGLPKAWRERCDNSAHFDAIVRSMAGMKG